MEERGNTTMVTIENTTDDFLESTTTPFTESDTTTLSETDIVRPTYFKSSLTDRNSSFTDTVTLTENGSSTATEMGTTKVIEIGVTKVTEIGVTKVTEIDVASVTSVTQRGSTKVPEWGTSGSNKYTFSSEESIFGSTPFPPSFTSAVPSAFHSSGSAVTGWFRSSAHVSFSSSSFNDSTTAFNDTDDWAGFYGGPSWTPGWFVSALDGYPYPSLYGWAHIVLASVVVTAIMLLIVLGNVLVIVAVAKDRNLSGIQNWFITSLALSDLFVGLFIMPLSLSYELMGYWTFGNVLCELWLSTDVLLCTASILNLVLISLDRYWSITRAISYVRQRTKRRAVLMIAAVWIMSMMISLPPLVGWKRPQPTKFGYPLCVLSEEPGYVIYSIIGSFYLPLVVMVMVYLKIYLAARNRARRNLRKTPPPVEGNHFRSGPTSVTGPAATAKNPRGKRKKAAVERASPTGEEMSTESPPPPHLPARPRSSMVEEEADEMEAEVAQVTIESVSPSTQSPMDPVTTFTPVSADPPSPFGPQFDVADSTPGHSPPLGLAASGVVHSSDVATSVASSSVDCSSVVQSSVVASSVAQPTSVALSSVVNSPNVALSVVPSAFVSSSVTQASDVALPVALSFVAAPSSVVTPSVVASSSVVPVSIVPPSIVLPSSVIVSSSGVPPSAISSSDVASSVVELSFVHTSVVPPCVAASSVAQSSDVLSSVIDLSDVASTVAHSPCLCPSSAVHPSNLASSEFPTTSVSPSVAVQPSVSSTGVQPQRINQARRSPTSQGTVVVNASVPSPAGPCLSESRRCAMSKRRRSCVASFTRRRSDPRCSNGVKDVERMKRKMARSRERRATVVLGIVMASFIGCWLPFFSLYPITLLVGVQLPDKLFAVIFWLGYCNSALNPIIYTIFNRDFRLAFQKILFSRRTKRF